MEHSDEQSLVGKRWAGLARGGSPGQDPERGPQRAFRYDGEDGGVLPVLVDG
jgi:hypothetical protein